jgi:hypothetical protein
MPKFKPEPFKKLIVELELEQKFPTPHFQFNMRSFGEKTECGTSACAMGKALLCRLLPGAYPTWTQFDLKPVTARGRELSYGDLGMEAFGITSEEFEELFTADGATDRDLGEQIDFMKRFLKRKMRAAHA